MDFSFQFLFPFLMSIPISTQGQFFFEQHLLFHQMEDLLNKYKVTFILKKDDATQPVRF